MKFPQKNAKILSSTAKDTLHKMDMMTCQFLKNAKHNMLGTCKLLLLLLLFYKFIKHHINVIYLNIMKNMQYNTNYSKLLYIS